MWKYISKRWYIQRKEIPLHCAFNTYMHTPAGMMSGNVKKLKNLTKHKNASTPNCQKRKGKKKHTSGCIRCVEMYAVLSGVG